MALVALHDILIQGLAGYIKDERVAYEMPSSMKDLFPFVTCIKLRIQARLQEHCSELLSLPCPPRSRLSVTLAQVPSAAATPSREGSGANVAWLHPPLTEGEEEEADVKSLHVLWAAQLFCHSVPR